MNLLNSFLIMSIHDYVFLYKKKKKVKRFLTQTVITVF